MKPIPFDLRFYNGKLQFRTGVVKIVGNPKERKWNDLPKYIDKVKWGKWKDVRDESSKEIN